MVTTDDHFSATGGTDPLGHGIEALRLAQDVGMAFMSRQSATAVLTEIDRLAERVFRLQQGILYRDSQIVDSEKDYLAARDEADALADKVRALMMVNDNLAAAVCRTAEPKATAIRFYRKLAGVPDHYVIGHCVIDNTFLVAIGLEL